ncbi:MAG: 4Fe-4S binding protein [Candidatus Thorarchaeota archaeon]
MAEDAERSEVDEVPEETRPSETKETTTPEPKKAEKKKGPRKLRNPVGFIFNIRMLRRIVQILFFLGINGYIFAAWWGNDAITAFWESFRNVLPTLPIIAPLEAPFGVIAGSFDTMQRELSSGFFPFFTLGAMIIILTVLGRVACGWICPIGTIQDFATLPKRTKIRPAPNTEKEMRRVKGYIFIIVFFLMAWVGITRLMGTSEDLVAVLGIFADAAFDPFNPAYILFVVIPQQVWPTGIDTLWYLSLWPTTVWLQVGFVAFVFVVSIWFPRWFCRWLCPAGWLYGLFSRDALIGIGRNPARCTPDTCNVCEVVCPMNIRIRDFPYDHMYSADCILCLECKSHCPNKAIELRFS